MFLASDATLCFPSNPELYELGHSYSPANECCSNISQAVSTVKDVSVSTMHFGKIPFPFAKLNLAFSLLLIHLHISRPFPIYVSYIARTRRTAKDELCRMKKGVLVSYGIGRIKGR